MRPNPSHIPRWSAVAALFAAVACVGPSQPAAEPEPVARTAASVPVSASPPPVAPALPAPPAPRAATPAAATSDDPVPVPSDLQAAAAERLAAVDPAAAAELAAIDPAHPDPYGPAADVAATAELPTKAD